MAYWFSFALLQTYFIGSLVALMVGWLSQRKLITYLSALGAMVTGWLSADLFTDLVDWWVF